MDSAEVLTKMAWHVRYELDKVVDFLVIGNDWADALRPDLRKLTTESILEAALIHTRCIAEFLRRTDGADKNDPSRSVVVARDYVPSWHWSDGEPLKLQLSELHGRVAHLGVIRAPVEDEGDFRWNEFIVLRDRPIPTILHGFRSFLRALAPLDIERYRLFNAPHSAFPAMTLDELITAILGT